MTKFRFETRYFPLRDQWYIYIRDLTGEIVASKAIQDGFDEEEIIQEAEALAKSLDSKTKPSM